MSDNKRHNVSLLEQTVKHLHIQQTQSSVSIYFEPCLWWCEEWKSIHLPSSFCFCQLLCKCSTMFTNSPFFCLQVLHVEYRFVSACSLETTTCYNKKSGASKIMSFKTLIFPVETEGAAESGVKVIFHCKSLFCISTTNPKLSWIEDIFFSFQCSFAVNGWFKKCTLHFAGSLQLYSHVSIKSI